MPPSTSIAGSGGTVRNPDRGRDWREFIAGGFFYREQINEGVDCSTASRTNPLLIAGMDEVAVTLKRTDGGGAWATADIDLYVSIDGSDYFALPTALTGDAATNGIDVRGWTWLRAQVATTHSIAATIAIQATGPITHR